jgi:hypothetical protein
MKPKDTHEDSVLATMRELPAYDVRSDRAERLRARCHSGFAMQESSRQSPQRSEAGVWPRAVRAVAGAWCVVYLVETIRRAAVVYGF